MKLSKIPLYEDGYFLVTIGGGLIFGVITAIGLGCLYGGLNGSYDNQAVTAAWGISLVSTAPCALFWWGLLNLFFSNNHCR